MSSPAKPPPDRAPGAAGPGPVSLGMPGLPVR